MSVFGSSFVSQPAAIRHTAVCLLCRVMSRRRRWGIWQKPDIDKLNLQPSWEVKVHPPRSDGLIVTSRTGLLRESGICGPGRFRKTKTALQFHLFWMCVFLIKFKVHVQSEMCFYDITASLEPVRIQNETYKCVMWKLKSQTLRMDYSVK